MSNKLVLIDGYSLLIRAYFAMPSLSNSKGVPTGAILGFVNILQKIIEDEKPTNLAVAMDLKEPTFRHKMFEGYKATRKPMDEELKEQIPLFYRLLDVAKIKHFSMAGFEADDIIGSIAKKVSGDENEVVIVSGDRDLLQLISEHTSVKLSKYVKGKSNTKLYGEAEVMQEFQVTAKGIIDLKALMGDASDNIPGVKGIGEKTATKLLNEFKTLDNLYENIDSVKSERTRNLLVNGKDMAYLSRKLAIINVDVPIEIDLDDLKFYDFYRDEATFDFFKELGFKKQLEKFSLSAIESEPVLPDMSFDYIKNKDDLENKISVLSGELAIHPIFVADKLYSLIFGNAQKSYAILFNYADFKGDFDFTAEFAADIIHKIIKQSKSLSVFNFKAIIKLLIKGKKESELYNEAVYNANKIFDLSLMAYIIDSNYGDKMLDISYLLSFLLDLNIINIKDIFLKKKDRELIYNNTESYISYFCGMQKLMAQAGTKTKSKLINDKGFDLYADIEFALSFVLADMELDGIAVNKQVLSDLSNQFDTKIAELQTDIYKIAGEEFNINSPKTLGDILFDKLGLPAGKKTQSGYSTAAAVLDKLKDDYEIVAKVLEYRHYSKLKSTYTDALPDYIDENGRIHTDFNQTIASTGRLSSTEPNLQNIPARDKDGRLIRKAFVPRDNCIFLDADYSQIELRVLADMSKDEALIKAYSEDADIHKMTAAAVFKVPLEEVTPELRRNAKAVNFGIIYGISAFGLSNDIDISMSDAKQFINNYFATFPKIKEFLDGLSEFAKKNGYAKTMFGRKRYIPELKSSNFMQRSFGERIAMNAPIQGSAADIIKIAMIRVHKRIRQEGLKARLILQVHDELLMEVPFDEKEQIFDILKNEMMKAADLAVPLDVDISKGDSWYSAK